MPELPEVETSRRGIEPWVVDQVVEQFVVRQPKLRWPIPEQCSQIEGQRIQKVARRAKYLLLETSAGICIIHLGMSGSLHVVPVGTPAQKHDHVDWCLSNGSCLRLRDPRRFGAVLWWELPLDAHPLFSRLGPEPLSDAFDGERLFQCSRARSISVKQLLMDNAVVVGVGNIYANEALFLARLHPQQMAKSISLASYQHLAKAIQQILAVAIEQGGTTLRDFSRVDGKPGYFKQQLAVYGRAGEACLNCGAPIQSLRIGQRNSFFCPVCQPKTKS
ncbi:bifunctional DNA-formamidopyrimidine glycosylase/DNA-(apurinic or apyrimidinic site) lyase [Celerinatantimonas sp. YJH-8]|uniref:bifunctional DNA-formamidopyrimidine glycosylase/DNA-(apurinic or apyrimidinic site) lyase n=1 Tax=Celerinatantimonas sp. YJH-8 TaxID=3228714 RepID=UPI0038BF5604